MIKGTATAPAYITRTCCKPSASRRGVGKIWSTGLISVFMNWSFLPRFSVAGRSRYNTRSCQAPVPIGLPNGTNVAHHWARPGDRRSAIRRSNWRSYACRSSRTNMEKAGFASCGYTAMARSTKSVNSTSRRCSRVTSRGPIPKRIIPHRCRRTPSRTWSMSSPAKTPGFPQRNSARCWRRNISTAIRRWLRLPSPPTRPNGAG